jgi:hypothetical protein
LEDKINSPIYDIKTFIGFNEHSAAFIHFKKTCCVPDFKVVKLNEKKFISAFIRIEDQNPPLLFVK